MRESAVSIHPRSDDRGRGHALLPHGHVRVRRVF